MQSAYVEKKSSRIRGFTLIELIAVIAILVVLAGLLIPRVDALQNKANKGVSASNQHEIAKSVMLFKAMHNTYPTTWDSLMDGSTLWKPTSNTAQGLEPQLVGGFGSTSGFPTKLTAYTLTQTDVDSLSRTGITGVRDKGTTFDIPGNAFNSAVRSLAAGGKVAVVNLADGDGQNIWRESFPGKSDTELWGSSPTSPTAGTFAAMGNLVVFGVGPSNEMVGDNMLTVPSYPNLDPTKYYNRYLVVFYVRNDEAKRAFLRTVLGADGDRIQEEIGDFNEKDQ